MRFIDLETHACGFIETSGNAPVTDFINGLFFLYISVLGLFIEFMFSSMICFEVVMYSTRRQNALLFMEIWLVIS